MEWDPRHSCSTLWDFYMLLMVWFMWLTHTITRYCLLVLSHAFDKFRLRPHSILVMVVWFCWNWTEWGYLQVVEFFLKSHR